MLSCPFYLVGTILYLLKGLFIIPATLLIIGFLYSFGLKIRNKRIRLKAGYGIKNAVVGAAWSFSITFSLEKINTAIFIFYFFKLFMNSAFFDLKDVDIDEIVTLPKLFGNQFKIFLTLMNVTLHLLTLTIFNHILVLSSFLLTQVSFVINEKTGRKIIDFE